jgi:hypothetical protein
LARLRFSIAGAAVSNVIEPVGVGLGHLVTANAVRLASASVSAPLSVAVSYVVRMSSREQMRRVDALWIIAPVTYYMASWDFSGMQHKRDAMCFVSEAFCQPELTVSSFGQAA